MVTRLFKTRATAAAIIAAAVFILAFGTWFVLRDVPESASVVEVQEENPRVIGSSVEGRAIKLYTFGSGENEILFVGGVHGGYEWNSVALAYKMIDYLIAYPEVIPHTVTVRVIPSLNPDGVYAVVGKDGHFTSDDVPVDAPNDGTGRFNAHDVDLNRNFDCKWRSESTWRSKTVSAGTSVFSEPEAQALQNVVEAYHPSAVVFWHSQANAVYASECEDGVLAGTYTLMNTYAEASGYTAVETFDAYAVTGDAEGWLASIGIPAVTVELSSHTSLDWDKNLKGVTAVLEMFTR